ncbi:MAG TPA: hypothetical protein VG937_04170 [Polyangiaceae bacterium]|nr:hypothetical protein [Polyangiaceae bacterium]
MIREPASPKLLVAGICSVTQGACSSSDGDSVGFGTGGGAQTSGGTSASTGGSATTGGRGKGLLVGAGCSSCSNSAWEVKSANLP